jgi:DNA-binding GntR family transcriptional regulator
VLERVVPVLRRVERMRFASFAGRSSVAQHATIIEHARAGEADAAAQVSLENWLSLRYTFEH